MPTKPGTPTKAIDASAVKRLAQDADYRQEAKTRYEQHTGSTAGKDILQRCKALNEFLESDFLKGGGKQSKEQLREILGMLHAPSKRPSFLDKPPVTATAAKTQPSNKALEGTSLSGSWGSKEADQILSLLEGQPEPDALIRSSAPASTFKAAPVEDVDDLIGLLNGGPTTTSMPRSAASQKQGGATAASNDTQRQLDADKVRREQEAQRLAQEEAQRAKAKAEEERLRREEEEKRRRQEAEEARKREEAEKQRREVEAARKREEEARRKREEEEEARRKREEAEAKRRAQEEQRRKEERRRREAEEAAERARRRNAAAVVIQCAVRRHQARKRLAELRRQRAAAIMLQAAERARAARAQLRALRLAAFVRRRAARCIAAAWRAYKSRWHLGPVRVPGSSLPGTTPMDGHAHLLALPLRLRSTADTRSAPEAGLGCGSPARSDSGDAAAASASGKRTAATVRRRAGEVARDEGAARGDVAARTVMAGSEHRDFQEVMHAVKAVGAGTVAAKAPPAGAKPAVGSKPPVSGGGMGIAAVTLSGTSASGGVGIPAAGSRPASRAGSRAGSFAGSQPSRPASRPGSNESTSR